MSLPAPEPPAPPSRAGCVVTLVLSFLAGMVGVGALLFLRAPSDSPRESALAAAIVEPQGYVRLDDAQAGGGTLDATGTGVLLSAGPVPGFRDALLRSWGKPAGEPPRAVVVLAVRLDSAASAAALVRSYGGTADAAAVPGHDGWVLVRQRDTAGRYATRVAFASGDLAFVVSVVTPAYEAETREVLALADRQAAG